MEKSKPLVYTGAPGDEQKYLVRQGGLMRCCLLTLGRWHAQQVEEGFKAEGVEQQVLPCDHCSSSMIFTDGAWEWNKARTDYELRS